MSNVKKQVLGVVLFAGTESSYGAGAALTGSIDGNAIQLAQDFPVFNIENAQDGTRKRAQMSAGYLPRVQPTGESISGKIKVEMKGSGSVNYGTAGAPNLDVLLKACGMSASLGVNSVIYKPRPVGTDPYSAALELYDRGELFSVSGSVGTFTITAADTSFAVCEFDMKGLPSTGSDSPTFPAQLFHSRDVFPPTCEGMTLTIGTYSGSVVRKFDFAMNQETSPRMNLQATRGHAGFAVGARTPLFKVTVEADVLAAFDAYSLYQNATVMAVTASVGTAGNGWSLTFPNAQITKVAKGADNSVALLDLEITPSVSDPSLSDDVALTFF